MPSANVLGCLLGATSMKLLSNRECRMFSKVWKSFTDEQNDLLLSLKLKGLQNLVVEW